MTSVTVVVPMTIRRRGGRKQIIGPDGAPVRADENGAGAATTRGDPALVTALARGFRWRRMLEEGRYASIREFAKAEGVDRAYVGRVLHLTLLAPGVVEAILDGRQPKDVTLPRLLALFPSEWERQQFVPVPLSSPYGGVSSGVVSPAVPALNTRRRCDSLALQLRTNAA